MNELRERLWRRWHRDDRAASMVEFAIVAPLLFMLVFGVIDFGRVYFLYNNLTNAARDGARYGAVLPPTGSVGAIQASVRARINDVKKDSGVVRVTYQTVSGVNTVKVVIDSFPFKPMSFIAIKSLKKLKVTAEFRLEAN
jgi:Flp pilus assembly protein TadG